jgi:hypothetical protein
VLKGMMAQQVQTAAWIAAWVLLISGATGLASYLWAPDAAPAGAVQEKTADGNNLPRMLPDTWEINFEHRQAADLRKGRWTDIGLPRGSRGAAASVAVDQREAGIFFEVSVPRAQQPLFAVHPNSHFHFSFRMDRPDWLNIFLIALCHDGSHSSNYLFNDLAFFPPEPGKWRTASIPVASFKRLYRDGVEPWKTEVPSLVIFSAPAPDRGLVVDRVWVTRGGPGRVQYQPAD